MKNTDPPIIVEQKFEVPVQKVWDAITIHDQMIKWFFENIPDFKPETGFEVVFDVHSESRVFSHRWKVTEVIPNKRIMYTWRYELYKGDSFVTFELFETGNQTLLRLTSTITEDFDDHIPEFLRESCMAGWEYFIKERLHSYLSDKYSLT